MNSVVLTGNLAKDPEIRYTQTQIAVCSFTLAANRPRTKNNENPGADFVRITAWGKLGENCSKYLQKGRKVAVKGRIHTGSYTNKDGQKVYTTDIVAEQVEFLGAPKSGQNDSPGYTNYTPSIEPNPESYQVPPDQQVAIGDDEIPPGFSMIDEDEVPF